MSTVAKKTVKKTKKVVKTEEPASEQPSVVEPVVEPPPLEPAEVEAEVVTTPEIDNAIDSGSSRKQNKTRRVEQVLTDLTILENKLTKDEETYSNKTAAINKQTVLKTIKSYKKLLKKLSTSVKKLEKRPKTQTSSSSGFNKPVSISKEMAEFAGWEDGVLKSRVDVTKSICKYITDNNLKNPANKRIILPDAKLAKLLEQGPDDKEDLTFAKLQKKICMHVGVVREAES